MPIGRDKHATEDCSLAMQHKQLLIAHDRRRNVTRCDGEAAMSFFAVGYYIWSAAVQIKAWLHQRVTRGSPQQWLLFTAHGLVTNAIGE